MKKYLQFYAAVVVTVVLFDVTASLASRLLVFDYTKLFWASWCIYFLAGFVGGKRLGFIGGISAGLVAGFADSTVGWFLSTAIGPYIPRRLPEFGILVVAVTVVIVSALGAFFGLIGATLAKLLKR